jgi:hypothetical protein
MALHFAQPPEASMNALNAVLPRIATRTSVATNAPNLGLAVGAALRRGQEGAPPVPAPISAPVHVLGLDQLAKGEDVKKSPVKLWTHLLHGEGGPAPIAEADLDASNHGFAALTEGDPITALGKRIRALEAEGKSSDKDYDLAMIRVPALSLTAVWMKGRGGAPDVIIPNESPQSPLTAGKRYTVAEFNAALRPIAQALLAQDNDDLGG